MTRASLRCRWRARRLREHLIKELRELRVASLIIWSDLHPIPGRDPQDSLPELHKRPARSQRLCCRNGDDDGFLDDQTLARVRLSRPQMIDQELLRLYLDRVPSVSHRDSCIFPRARAAHWIVYARRYLQQLFLRRLRRIHKVRRYRHAHSGYRRRWRRHADFAGPGAIEGDALEAALALGTPKVGPWVARPLQSWIRCADGS